MGDGGIEGYYDRLARWNHAARAIGYGGGSDALTVHRALADPRAGGRATTTRLHDVLIERLPPLVNPRVLDAGCGLGGTMIDLARRLGGQCVGLTLSHEQAALATRAAKRLGLADRIAVHVQSYDTPPAGPFDLIVAIESLAHSLDPGVSLGALARVLRPGAVIAVVDDMPTANAGAATDLADFKSGWRCPVLWTHEQYLQTFAAIGLTLTADVNLTADSRPRPLSSIAVLQRLNRVAAALVPSAPFRRVLESHHGGLALERLYRHGLVEYRMLMARASGVLHCS